MLTRPRCHGGNCEYPSLFLLILNFGTRTMAWLLSLYTLICLFFLDNTYREGEAQGGAWDGMRVLGLVLCLLWPLLIVHVIISAYRDRQTAGRRP